MVNREGERGLRKFQVGRDIIQRRYFTCIEQKQGYENEIISLKCRMDCGCLKWRLK